MKVTINTEILRKYNLSLGEFLVMLLGYYNVKYKDIYTKLVENNIINKNLFDSFEIVLSDNTKNLIAKIITESDEKLLQVDIDFDELALKLMELYPDGNKPGTTYSWRGKKEDIAQKLRVLITKHNFIFTPQEAVDAVKEYINTTEPDEHRKILKNFILKTIKDSQGNWDIESLFMSTIENNRSNS